MLELASISTRLIKRFKYNFAVAVNACYLFSFIVYTSNFIIIVDTLRHIFSTSIFRPRLNCVLVIVIQLFLYI